MKKIMCAQCGKIFELNENEQTKDCPTCGYRVDAYIGSQDYYKYIVKLTGFADKNLTEGISFDEAFRIYKELYEIDDTELDFFIGYNLSLLKTSTFLNTHSLDVYNNILNKEIDLSKETYIRLGHFFEMLYRSLFKIIDYNNSKYAETITTNEEKIMIAKNLVEANKLYTLLDECLKTFSETELNDSFYLDESSLEDRRLKLRRKIKELNEIKEEDGEYLIKLQDKNLKSYEINKDLFKDVHDGQIFIIKDNLNKFKWVFASLIFLVLLMTIGLVLAFTGFKIAGYAVLGTSIGLFIIIYYVFSQLRKKEIEKLNN